MYKLNGSTDAFGLPDVPNVGDFTIALTYAVGAGGDGGGTLLSFNDYPTHDPNNTVIQFFPSGNSVLQVNGGWSGQKGFGAPATGQPHKVVIRHSGTTSEVWVDGVKVASDSNTAGTFTAANIRIGCLGWNGSNIELSAASVSGYTLHSSAWSDADIAAHAAGTDPATIETGTLVYSLPLDTDAEEKHQHATVTTFGQPSWIAPYAVAVSSAGTVAPGGTVPVVLSWLSPTGGNLTVTATAAGGLTVTPATLTLAAAKSSTASATITVPEGATAGPCPITWSVPGMSDVTTSLTVQVPAPGLTFLRKSILPSGNILAFVFSDPANPMNLPEPWVNVVRPCDPSACTLTVNGNRIPLGPWMYTGNGLPPDNPDHTNADPILWCTLGQKQCVAYLDDADAGVAFLPATGSGWAQQTIGNPSGTFAIGNNQFHSTTTVTDAVTYTRTGLIPGRYKVYANLNLITTYDHLYNGHNLTTDARYAVTDPNASDAVVGDFHVDQSRGLALPFDTIGNGVQWTLLGTTSAISGTTLEVTLSNAAGAGALATDSIRVEYVPPRIVPADATVTFTAGDGWCLTASGPMGSADALPITVETDETWFPSEPTGPTTLKAGWNMQPQASGEFGMMTANRWYGQGMLGNAWPQGAISPWSGNSPDRNGAPPIDGDLNLNSIKANEVVNTGIIAGTCGVGAGDFDNWGIPTFSPGVWRVRFAYSGQQPDLAGVKFEVYDYQNNNTPITNSGVTFNATLKKYEFTADVGSPDPVMLFQSGLVASPALALRLTNGGPDVTGTFSGWEFYDPDTPVDWPHFAHPWAVRQFQGKGVEVDRWLDNWQVNGGNACKYSQLPQDGKQCYAFNHVLQSATVDHIRPATQDEIKQWFGDNNALINSAAAVVVTTTPHGFVAGQGISHTDETNSGPWPSTNGGQLSYGASTGAVIGPLSPTEFLVTLDTTTPVQGKPDTLTANQTPGGRFLFAAGAGAPVKDVCRYSNDLGIGAWLLVPISYGRIETPTGSDPNWPWLDDAPYNDLIGEVAANLTGKCYFECISNEVWNWGFWSQRASCYSMGMQVGHQNSHEPAVGAPNIASGSPVNVDAMAAQVYIADKAAQKAIAAWTGAGRARSDLVIVFGAQVDAAPWAASYLQGKHFDAIAIAPYMDNGLPGAMGDLNYTTGMVPYTAVSDSMSVDDHIDVYGLHTNYNRFTTYVWRAGKQVPTFKNADGNPIRVIGYEGGLQVPILAPGDGNMFNTRAMQVLHSHRTGKLLRSWLARLNGFMDVFTYYTKSASAGFPTNGWRCFDSFNQVAGIGDGSDGLHDNRTNPCDVARGVSVLGGAMLDFTARSSNLPRSYIPSTARLAASGVAQPVTATIAAASGEHSIGVTATHGTLSAPRITIASGSTSGSVTLTPDGTGDPVVTFLPTYSLTPTVGSITVSLGQSTTTTTVGPVVGSAIFKGTRQ